MGLAYSFWCSKCKFPHAGECVVANPCREICYTCPAGYCQCGATAAPSPTAFPSPGTLWAFESDVGGGWVRHSAVARVLNFTSGGGSGPDVVLYEMVEPFTLRGSRHSMPLPAWNPGDWTSPSGIHFRWVRQP